MAWKKVSIVRTDLAFIEYVSGTSISGGVGRDEDDELGIRKR